MDIQAEITKMWYNTNMDEKTIIIAVAVIALVMNTASFLLMGYDKRKARLGARRVRERTLFIAAACFGALGGVLAMKIFRHKTRPLSFRIFYPALLIIQTAVLIFGAYMLFL